MPRHQIANRLQTEHHSLEILQKLIVHFSCDTRLFDRAHLQSDGLRLLLFAHIQRKNYSLGTTLLESCHAHQYRHARSVFAEEFLLEWLQASNPSYPFDPLFVGGVPLWRCQVRQAQAARNEIGPLVSQHAKVCVIGLKDRTSDIYDVYPDNVGVDQAPHLRFPLAKIAVETRIFESARCQRRDQL